MVPVRIDFKERFRRGRDFVSIHENRHTVAAAADSIGIPGKPIVVPLCRIASANRRRNVKGPYAADMRRGLVVIADADNQPALPVAVVRREGYPEEIADIVVDPAQVDQVQLVGTAG